MRREGIDVRFAHTSRMRGLLAILLGAAFCLTLPLQAQGRGGGGAPGGGGAGSGGGPGQPGGGSGQPGFGGGIGGNRGGIPPAGAGSRGGAPAGGTGSGRSMQMRPVGRWWDDKSYANALSLKPEQKRRMDAIFNGNRGELTERVQTLRQEESKLEAETRDTHLSQESIFGQMDRVAQARDALEKVNTRLVQSLEKELEPGQLERMQTLK